MTSFDPPRLFDRQTQPHIFTLVLLASISALAMNIFLPSLPNMATHFATTPAVMGLTVGIYLAASAVIQIFCGPISDAIGRRPVILWSLAIFTIASLLTPFAPNVQIFLTLRAVQAMSACCMVLSRAIIRDTTDTNASGSKIAYVTMGMSVVPMLSPAVGGFLDGTTGWQGSFFLTGGIGVVLLLVCYFDLGETAPATQNSMKQQLKEYPELLTSPRFWGYCMASTLGSGSFFAYLGGAPFVGSEVFGLSPSTLGLYFGAPAVGYFVGNFLSGRYSMTFGIDAMATWGLTVTAGGLSISLLIAYVGTSTPLSFFGGMVAIGVGNGLTLPNSSAGMLSVRPKLAGSASGLGSAIMIGGGALLSALAGVMLDGATSDKPLLWIMWVPAVLGIIVILMTARRNRRMSQ